MALYDAYAAWCREPGTLLKERIQHTNRIKGLLGGQGIALK